MEPNSNSTVNEQGSLLYKYALEGNWEEASRSIFSEFPEMVSTPLTPSGDTALHLAVIANETDFAQKFITLEQVTREVLEKKNANGITAFCMAAILGHGEAKLFKAMIQKSPNLPLKRGDNNKDSMLPVHLAALNGHHNIVEILISTDVMNLQESTYEAADIKRLFFLTIRNNMYAVATKLLVKYRDMATAREGPDDQTPTALHMLARESSQEYHKQMENDELVKKLWGQVNRLEHEDILKLINKPSMVLFDAVKSGNSYVLQYILIMNPELRNIKDPDGKNILHLAALYRRQNDFSFILSEKIWKPLKFIVDKNRNNVLHFAARYRDETSFSIMKPTIIQMQKQLEWFKEVETYVPELLRMKNMEDKTPEDVLRTNQEKLLKQIKYSPIRIANYSMIVATIIATITFAAILTVPGDKFHAILTVTGAKSNGTLIEVPTDDESNGWFIVFILTNAHAVLLSSASIVSFLSVLNSQRFTDNDIGILLHPRLIVGLVLLSISIIAMVLALVAALVLIFADNSKWVAFSVVPPPIIVVCVVVISSYIRRWLGVLL